MELGGWRLKQLDEKSCKVTYVVNLDLKAPLFLTKQVGPKSANVTLGLKQYIERTTNE